MKSIRKVLAGTLLAGGVLLAASSLSIAVAADDAAAPTPPPSGPQGPGPHRGGPGHLLAQLNLTAEQKASIKTIMEAAKPNMKSLHEQMHANHLKEMQTKPDDPNYASIVAEVAQSNAALASQRTSQAADIRGKIYTLLTPAQKTQLATLEAQWAAKPHHGPWGHRAGANGAPPTAPEAQ